MAAKRKSREEYRQEVAECLGIADEEHLRAENSRLMGVAEELFAALQGLLWNPGWGYHQRKAKEVLDEHSDLEVLK